MKLPVADAATVRAYAGDLLSRHRRPLGGIAALHTLAAVAGLGDDVEVLSATVEPLAGVRVGRLIVDTPEARTDEVVARLRAAGLDPLAAPVTEQEVA